MRHRERNYLFADFDLSDSLRANQAGIQEQVDRMPKDQSLLGSDQAVLLIFQDKRSKNGCFDSLKGYFQG